jgi:hypothetical protein
MTIRTILAAALALAAVAGTAPAQVDPAREIQEIARQVEEQLQEIDRLLIESGRKNQPRANPKELLDRARERSEVAEDGIDKLIEKLNEMKSQGGGSGSPDDQQDPNQQPQDSPGQQGRQGRPNQGQRNRRENQTPDLVPRPQSGQEQQGQEQQGQQQRQGQQPVGGQENPDGGENTRGDNPPQSETGAPNPGTGEGNWGELQPYMNFLKNRGSRPPAVPEKFRKYWEAYLKQKQGAGGGR